MNILNKTESAVFLYCRFSLFLKDLGGVLLGFFVVFFFRLFRGRNSCRCFCMVLVKFLHVHRYSVDFFSYSGPSGIFGSDGKQNTA